jgi:hypothetical protein
MASKEERDFMDVQHRLLYQRHLRMSSMLWYLSI